MTNFDKRVIITIQSALSGTKEGDNMLKISLKSARVNAGYSQKSASTKLGVSNKTLSSWENGATVPKADMVDKICRLYNVEYDSVNFLPNNPL